ncbi:MAG: hypothetical protein JWO88_3627 [Frankiales bacterium]|nr:hypothetical protein [Frankiales bacterium]
MSQFPVALFPAAGASVKSGGFVVAVLVGLALFMAAKKNATTQQSQQQFGLR